MAPPSSLIIAAQAVNRLVKEESYYHKEQENQDKRIAKLEDDIAANSPDLDDNAEYILKQEVGHPFLSITDISDVKIRELTLTLIPCRKPPWRRPRRCLSR